MEKIITISGKAESGKDTFAIFFKELLPNERVLIIHYGDYLKYIASQYFGWNGIKDEAGRSLLQWLGTEKIRSQYPDFWVSAVADIMKILWFDYDYFLIPDCRYLNEINFLKKQKLPVFSLRIHRLNHENSLTIAQRNHISENELDYYPFHYNIYADEGLDRAKREVEKFISTYNLKI